MKPGLLVFTDLDGSLLDHADYSYRDAIPTLERLKSQAIPLILCSSKTAVEIASLRAELGFAHCEAIVENGAGILDPHQERIESRRTHDRLLAELQSLPSGLSRHFSGFSGWSLDRLMARTGLDRTGAKRARQRDFSEPGIWSGSEALKADFIAALGSRGIQAQAGGRFLTLSFAAGKAVAMRQVLARYRAGGKQVLSIALGDAPNDSEMISGADLGIIIPNPEHGGIPQLAGEAEGRIVRAERPGPRGWNDSLSAMLDKLQADYQEEGT